MSSLATGFRILSKNQKIIDVIKATLRDKDLVMWSRGRWTYGFAVAPANIRTVIVQKAEGRIVDPLTLAKELSESAVPLVVHAKMPKDAAFHEWTAALIRDLDSDAISMTVARSTGSDEKRSISRRQGLRKVAGRPQEARGRAIGSSASLCARTDLRTSLGAIL